MKTLLRIIFRFFFQVEIQIPEKSTTTEGIIVCNHQSFLDGILLGVFLPQSPLFVIDKAIAKRWYFSLPLKWIDHVTVDSSHPMSIKYLIEKAKEGRSIAIFPEGRITLTGSFMKFYEGAAFIAYRTGMPLIPVYLQGAEFSLFSRLQGLVKRKIFTKITLTVTEPIEINVPQTIRGRARRQYLADFLQKTFMDFRIECFKPTTIFAALLKARQHYGGQRILGEDLQRHPQTYNQFIKKSIALGAVLSQFTEPKERVGILLPNALVTATAIMGLSANQRTPAMLNYTAGLRGMAAAISAAEIKTVITSRRFIKKAKLETMIAHFPKLNWLYLEDLRKEVTPLTKLLILVRQYFPKWTHRHNFRPLDKNPWVKKEAVILFTSGSEGLPKGVVHTHHSLLTNVEQLRTVSDLNTQDIFMVTLPLFHAFGLTAGLFLPMVCGAKAFLYPSPLHYRVIPEIIYDIQATVLFGTSTFLLNYAKRGTPYDFASLRYVVAGAERLTPETSKIWHEKIGKPILEGYGVTECAPVISLNIPLRYEKGTVGRVLPGIETKLKLIAGIKKGGELIIRGGNVMAGYLLTDKPGQLVVPKYEGEEGWHSTGDIVTLNSQGFMTIQGRTKRFAKIAGEMVSLEVVENLVASLYPEEHHAALTQPDSKRGEKIILFTTEKNIERQAIISAAQKEGVSELFIPREIKILPSLPLLGSGKIDYQILMEGLMEDFTAKI